MKLATRAKLKSVSKQFVDNLATHTNRYKDTHTLWQSHALQKHSFCRTLATPVACLRQVSTQCVHSLSHFALSSLLSFLHSLSLSFMLTPTHHAVCCALLFRRQQQTRFGAITKSGFFSLICFVLSFSLNSLQLALPLPLSLLLPAVLGWLPWLSLHFSCRLLVATCGSVSGNSLWVPHSHSHSDSLALAFSFVSLFAPLSLYLQLCGQIIREALRVCARVKHWVRVLMYVWVSFACFNKQTRFIGKGRGGKDDSAGGRRICRQTGKQRDRQTGRQTNWQTNRQTERLTGRQTNRQTNRQKVSQRN